MESKIVQSTKSLLDLSNKLFYEKNKKYYEDVLDFLNLLFEDNSKIITKINFKKITLNENIFLLYNEIIKIYKLDKPTFNLDKFDLSIIDGLDNINQIFYDIALKLSNNILNNINYKLKTKKIENKIKFTIVNI